MRMGFATVRTTRRPRRLRGAGAWGLVALLLSPAGQAFAEDAAASPGGRTSYPPRLGAILSSGGSDRYEDARTPPLVDYRVRVDDVLDFLFRLEKETSGRAYRLHPGDRLRMRSLTIRSMNREFTIEPDGMVTLPVLGRTPAAGSTIAELQEVLSARAGDAVREPDLVITPLSLFSALDEFQSSIAGLQAHGELVYTARVAPDGTVQIPAVETLPALGLTLPEIEREADARFARVLDGVRVTVILRQKAAGTVTVAGEVGRPGRFPLAAPTSVSGAISLAGGWINGADLRNIVVLRRDEQWRLIATSLDMRGALHGQDSRHEREIWLRDGDTVLVPKTALRRFDDKVQLVFTNGLYRLLPFNAAVQAIWVDGQAEDAVISQPPADTP